MAMVRARAHSSCARDSCLAVNETAVIRWDYGDPQLGTCKETIEGGAHFRYWVQNGDKADRSVRPLHCESVVSCPVVELFLWLLHMRSQ